MEAGDLELRKAFEEVTTKNVRTVVAFSKDTRELVRKLEQKVEHLAATSRSQTDTIEQLRMQLSVVQAKLYGGGTT